MEVMVPSSGLISHVLVRDISSRHTAGPLAQAVLVRILLGEVIDLEGCAAGCVDSLAGESGHKAY
jgi:hypothetical protein